MLTSWANEARNAGITGMLRPGKHMDMVAVRTGIDEKRKELAAALAAAGIQGIGFKPFKVVLLQVLAAGAAKF